MNKGDQKLFVEILGMKLSEAALGRIKLNTNTNKNEGCNRGLSVSVPKNFNYSRNVYAW